MRSLRILSIASVWWLFLLFMDVSAQDAEKVTLRLDLTYHRQENGQLPMLRTSTMTKVGKRFEPVHDVEINIFFNEETSKGFLGRIKTSDKGTAFLTIPNEFTYELDSSAALKFIATVTDNEKFEDVSSEIEIAKAQIELTLNEEDSIRIMKAKVLLFEEGSWKPAPETEIKFVVKRLLSDLNAGEEELYTTDELGEASSEFKLNIPGNANGDVIIAAKIDESDVYGSISSSKAVKWGTPLMSDNSFAKRTLWSTRDKTPWWLLIFPNLIIASVWGVILYLIYQIIEIRKIGKTHKNL